MTMNHQDNSPKLSRRSALGSAAAVAGGFLLESLATGLPAQVLLDPLNASADQMPNGAKYLVMTSNRNGDPTNANIPGTYGFSDLYHPPDPAMVETPLDWQGPATTAAKPWADLGSGILDRTVFFHHATYTPVHGEMARVQRMMDNTEKNDMFVSLLARELAPILGSVQSDPVSLGARGNELITSAGRVLGNVAPLAVQQALGGVEGPLKALTDMRDVQIDRIYNLYREYGTPSQKTLLDAWVRSRDEVRSISIDLIDRLDQITGNNEINQVRCAAVLVAMRIAPVVSIRLEFGADNHVDANLQREADEHVEGCANLKLLMDELDALKSQGHLQNDCLVAVLNVFGRTLKKKGIAGRDHHKGHHGLIFMGDGLQSSIVGGVALNENGSEYFAQGIDSATGAMNPDGDIPYEETLGAAAKTMGWAMGVEEERLHQMLPPGKIVKSVCA